ncbi:MAG: hypothetical protein JO353_10710, partial [Phycisphaerae bacterium]|nr:hypothetical protein [Phycisphaerae bacterium]
NSRIATRETDYTQIFNDLTAITNAVKTDSNASSALVTAANQFVADRTTSLETLNKDLHRIADDRAKLVVDLKALQSQD